MKYQVILPKSVLKALNRLPQPMIDRILVRLSFQVTSLRIQRKFAALEAHEKDCSRLPQRPV